ncbi:hypothetical protein GUJ93_ZPchr0009g2020 [Zizania palustris]|uniref:Uncharacterized protein n=1 Tax=Zizania palustris TaxID=103762 RepID=A0A8J5R8A8_ZIZPA|nr:hypothetical protein GUJ93_ZPchr0009g2020 [Zizania palustris]
MCNLPLPFFLIMLKNYTLRNENGWLGPAPSIHPCVSVSPLPCAAEQRDIARDRDREAEYVVMSQKAEQCQELRLSLPHATALAVAHSSCFFLLSYRYKSIVSLLPAIPLLSHPAKAHLTSLQTELCCSLFSLAIGAGGRRGASVSLSVRPPARRRAPINGL